MFSKGADVDALRDSAGRMASFGREVDVVRSRGQRAVSAMQRAWQGSDFQPLLERWRRVEHDLVRISTEFDQLSRRLHDNADLQHRSSGSSSHHGGGSSGESAHGSHGRHAPRPVARDVGWGPDGGRPLVTPGVPQAQLSMGWGHWFGTTLVPGGEPPGYDGWHGPSVPAHLAAEAAHGLGRPIR